MSALSHIDAIRNALEAEQSAADAKVKEAVDKAAALQAEIDAKNAQLARLTEQISGQKRMLDHFGDGCSQDTVKRAKEALDLLQQVGGVDAIKVLVAERERADKEAAERAAAAQAAQAAAAQAAALAASQAAARAAAQAAARANRVSAEEARKIYDAMMSTSGFQVGQLCCVNWTRKMCSLVEIASVPNCDFPDHIQARVVVSFGQAAYVHFSAADARRYFEVLTRDNIVGVQQRIFSTANLKCLHREDSQTLERLKSAVPDFSVYTNRVRIQTRDAIAKHPDFAGIVDVYNGKRAAVSGANYKELSDAQISSMARRDACPVARSTNPAAAALMAMQASSPDQGSSQGSSSGEGSSSDSTVKPEPAPQNAGIQEIEDNDGDDECRAVGFRTVDDRNRVGFANAIVLD